MLRLTAKPTLTPVELDPGESVAFTLDCGRTVTLELLDTHAEVLLTNLKDTMVEDRKGGTVLRFACTLRVDGQPLELERYLCVQQSFYEPVVVNGLRIWFDAVDKIFHHIIESHGPCRPRKAARFALQDAARPPCPEVLAMWCPRETPYIDIRECYNGDDCWLGPYLGASAHGGLDINHPRGTTVKVPFSVDEQWLYNSLKAGHVNNRWRGIRQWPDGSSWVVHVCHLIEMLVPEHTPLKAGTVFATTAGTWVGTHDHTHFYFAVDERGRRFQLDPWILFWQMFEQHRDAEGAVRAAIAPLAPVQTGEAVRFDAAGSRASPRGGKLEYHWTFGDGAVAREAGPKHVFTRPGVYPVTLTVDDGYERATFTQHVTVNGAPVAAPALVLDAPDALAFAPRPQCQSDIYGEEPKALPHALRFRARGKTNAQAIFLRNACGGELAVAADPKIEYSSGTGWLRVELSGSGNAQEASLSADASGLAPGTYRARVAFSVPGALNGEQSVLVELAVPAEPPLRGQVVDNAHAGFACVPNNWFAPRFFSWSLPGYGPGYLVHAPNGQTGARARFSPDLAAGRYEVALSHKTPFPKDARLPVRVVHRGGESRCVVEPARNRTIGTFFFEEDGAAFVELQTESAGGPVFADAVVFRKAD